MLTFLARLLLASAAILALLLLVMSVLAIFGTSFVGLSLSALAGGCFGYLSAAILRKLV